jgi:6,7-dimethyl-8-ribityllumazine synthase
MPNYQIVEGAAQPVGRSVTAGTSAVGRRVAVVAARFNADIVDAMVSGALAVWMQQGGAESDLVLVRAPGAFELPLLSRRLAQSGKFDAVIALGCVIRGDTAHFDFVAGEAARGIADAARDTGVPVIFGVLTTETVEQALERASTSRMDKGGEAMHAALEMAQVLQGIAAL